MPTVQLFFKILAYAIVVPFTVAWFAATIYLLVNP